MAKTGFYLLTLFAILMLIPVLRNDRKDVNKVIKGYFILVAIWISYVFGLSFSGMFNDFSLPPRLPLMVIVPAIIGSVYLTGRASFRDILQYTPPYLPVLLQSFRIAVELLIFAAWSEGFFPKRVTFEGLNFDILVGITAPLVALLLYKKILGLNAVLVWNIAGLAILGLTGFAFLSAYFIPEFAESIDKTDFIKFPFILLPSVLLPIAIFLHIFSIRQILRMKNST